MSKRNVQIQTRQKGWYTVEHEKAQPKQRKRIGRKASQAIIG